MLTTKNKNTMENIFNRLLKYKWLSIIIIVSITVFFMFEMKKNSTMETNLDKYMPQDHPAFIYSDMAEDWFNIKDGILIAIENKNGIYNSNTLQKIKDISKGISDMDGFAESDIMSLYTADNIIGSEYGMEVESFYKKVPTSEEKLNELQSNVRNNDMVFGRVVSEDETVALIVAGMNDSIFTDDFYEEILNFAKSYEDEENTIYIAGRPIVEGTMGKLGPSDMKRMVPIVLIVIIIVLYLILKSVSATIATMLSVLFSTVWAFGLMAFLGVPVYSVSTMIPVMLIAIGVAYGIYFYNILGQYYKQNQKASRFDAVKFSLLKLWKPLFMAAFTTIVGFVSLVTSQVYPIKYFGLFTAFGIFAAFIMALSFIPAFVIVFGYKPGKSVRTKGEKINDLLSKSTDTLIRKKKVVYLVVALAIIVSLVGISKVWINSSFLDKFAKDSDIVLTDKFVNSKFGGTSTINVILEAEEGDAFKNPETLRIIDDLQRETESLEKVGNSFSMVDYLKRMNKVMNSDNDEYYAVPESKEMIAQYLLLYEMSGDPENLTKVVNYNYDKTNITFQLKGDDSKTINEAINIIESFREDFKERGIEINFAGSGYKALVFTDLILEGQIWSLILSLVAVFLILVVMFRSVKAGIFGSLPILITALFSFGIMGLFNIPLSTTTALLSSIAIGIGIDYAIHFMQNYRTAIKETETRNEAIHQTMRTTGKAILSNAVVVIAGFLVLLFSVFPPNRTLGALVSLNMFTSFLGTLSIMMILIYMSKLFMKDKSKSIISKT